MENGAFRRDLYHRLNVIHLSVPPLRRRPADIPFLAEHFLRKHANSSVTLSPRVMQRFLDYPWPGNVRELENTILYMLAVSSDRVLRADNLPTNLHYDLGGTGLPPVNSESPLPLAEIERRHILEVIEHTRGDVTAAAHILGIGKTTLYRKMKLYARDRSVSSPDQGLARKAAGA
jgi:DNA-binding NtrC family response regulator